MSSLGKYPDPGSQIILKICLPQGHHVQFRRSQTFCPLTQNLILNLHNTATSDQIMAGLILGTHTSETISKSPVNSPEMRAFFSASNTQTLPALTSVAGSRNQVITSHV